MDQQQKLEQLLRQSVVALLFVTPLLSLSFLMEPWHLKWSGFYLASSLAALYLAFQSKVEIPSGFIQKCIFAVIIARLASYALFPGLLSFVNAVDSVSLFILVLFFISIFRDKKLEIENLQWPVTIVAGILAVLCVVQFFIYRISQQIPDPQLFSATFGNINMLLEFQNFLYPLLFFFLRRKTGLSRNILIVVCTLSFFCLFIGASRSALMAVLLYFAFCLYRRKFVYEFVCFAIALGAYTAVTPYILADKNNFMRKDVTYRSEMYRGALHMLAENPLGYGADGFDFNYTPYQLSTLEKPVELMHYESPHNEFLKWGIEGGWLFLLAQLLFWAVFFFHALKMSLKDDKSFLLKALMFVILPQMMFQFPFELGVSNFIMAFIFAMYFANEKTEVLQNQKILKIGTAVVALGLLWNMLAYSVSFYIHENYEKDFAALNFGCKIYPNNWNACILAGKEKALGPQPLEGIPFFKKELERRPFNWIALKMVAFSYFQANESFRACESGVMYSLLMNGVGTGPAAVGARCVGVPSPVPYQTPKQFETDYRIWLTKYLSN